MIHSRDRRNINEIFSQHNISVRISHLHGSMCRHLHLQHQSHGKLGNTARLPSSDLSCAINAVAITTSKFSFPSFPATTKFPNLCSVTGKTAPTAPPSQHSPTLYGHSSSTPFHSCRRGPCRGRPRGVSVPIRSCRASILFC